MYTIDILNKNNTAFSKILNPQGLNFKLTLTGKDTAKFILPLSHPRAEAENLKKHNRIIINRVNPKDRTDVRRIWVGYIEAVRIVDDNNLEVGCKGIYQLLKFADILYRCKQLKRAVLGRMASGIKKLAKSLEYLEDVRMHLKRLPFIDPARTLYF